MLKLFYNLDSLTKVPLTVHKLGIIWLYKCWQKVVFENGFIDIDNTLKYIDINVVVFVVLQL